MFSLNGSPRRLLGAAALVGMLVLSACGEAATPVPTPPTTGAGTAATATTGTGSAMEPAPPANADELKGLSGDVIIDGSSTVYPITAAASEEFNRYAPNVRIPVGIAGTGGGFKKFCAGESDIQNASRPISPSEVAACGEKNIEYIELPVAFDGLAVVVNPKNTWADSLTVAELKKIWEPEAEGKITNWNQVRDGFPDKALKLFGAGTDSGTFDYFTEAINGKAKASRGDFQASEDDNVLVTGVSGDEGALGFFGLAYYAENADKLKLVGIDAKGTGTVVQPSIETVKSGAYQPLSRPLFIYVRKDAAARPEVKAFINFYLSGSFTPLVQSREVGYIALEDPMYQAVAARFAAGTTGTLFPNGAEVGATLDRYLKP